MTPEIPGLITAEELQRTAQRIADWQLPSGMIPWFPGGHADPWNHVEAAMAMATCGLVDEAVAGYQWLIDQQRSDGSWHNYYLADGIEDAKLDSNCVAYFAAGVWHHWLTTGDRDFIEHCWPALESAIEWVLDLQTRRGEIIWARHAEGTPWSYALLTGSSSISHSLWCADQVAELRGTPRSHWSEARDRLVNVIANHPEAFEPKDRWAMDWYYPVMTGALRGDAARQRLKAQWDDFVMDGKGVRCVSDRPWVTAAETCECAMAHVAAGDTDSARTLFRWAQALRDEDGRYYTGIVFPELVHFPDKEQTTYTFAAVILAADAIDGRSPTAKLFT